MSGKFLRILLNFAEAAFRRRGAFFQRRGAGFDRSRRAQVRFVESHPVRNQLAVRAAASFNFEVETAQNIGGSIVLAAAQKTAVGLDRSSIGQANDSIGAIEIANGESVGVTPHHHPFDLHSLAAGDRPGSGLICVGV